MQTEQKIEAAEKLVKELKTLAADAYAGKRYEKSLAAISACAWFLYEYNQRYTDDELENLIEKISKKVVAVPREFSHKHQKKTVLYYDGFGLDLRGNAITETVAIASSGYRLVYVTAKSAIVRQPNLKRELKNYDVIYENIDMKHSYLSWVEELNEIFLKYEPDTAFFYTTPNDVSAAVVFNRYNGITTRILSDLTDHAFWLGVNSFDYIINNRTIGQSIERFFRGIPKEKLIRCYGNCYYRDDIELESLPFDAERFRFVFSGGALYKTLGDSENTYYRIVEHIVRNHEDVVFLYAGSGDASQFALLITKYPGRIFLVPEREDFFQVMRHCVFYLNTYPMFGGLMMSFAAYANKIPVTLKHDNDADDNLIDQKNLGIEFDSYEDIVKEIDRLLEDEDYRSAKERIVSSSVLTKEQGSLIYADLIENNKSDFPVVLDENVNTERFRSEYIERLDVRKAKRRSIGKMINYSLALHYPGVFICRAIDGCKILLKIMGNRNGY